MEKETKYKMRVIRGAFINTDFLDILNPVVIEKFGDEWIELDEIVVTLEETKKLQGLMVRHYDNSAPWYMDGFEVNNKNQMIVAFGSDDGENGKVFFFNRNNKDKIKEVQDYGISKGIPVEQMDFGKVDF